jgi:dolichol-phosphate mannosyltransferase
MFTGQSVVAVIPVYRECGKIGNVISKFTDDSVDEVCLVVDQPSKTILGEIEDAGKSIRVPVHVIENPKRNGIGYAIREGIDYALSKRFDVIVILAGNNKDDPREIPRFLRAIVKEGFDYVQGSRFLPGGRREKTPIFRAIFIRLYPFFWTLFTGIRCTDVTNGFRAYRTMILKDTGINIWQDWLNGYAMEYYIHFKVLKLRFKTKEVAVSKIYPYMHKGGYSKISPLHDFWSIVGPFAYLVMGVKE